MKILKEKILYLFTILTILACEKDHNATFDITDEALITSNKSETDEIKVERKLIKVGDFEFETDNIDLTRKQIIENVRKYKGYTSVDQEYKSTSRLTNKIIIRVPSNNFDLLLKEVTKGIAEFDNKEIKVKDVTEEFLDIQARLKTKKELEKRYLEILTKVKNVTEILEV